MKNFITNSEAETLKKRLTELITKSEELKFLVGFFYFSGIHELYEELKNNPDVKVKVLVGLNVDKTNKGILEYAEPEQSLSDEERSYKFLQSVKHSINRSEFDTQEFYEQVKFFIELIKQDRLIIKKTYQPNHSKLYLFKLQKDQVGKKELFVTGSSNLTRAGLTTQEEFNVEISDYGFKDAEEYFDSLWEEAVKITEDDVTKTKLIMTIEKETLVKEITPFEAFVLVLKSYLDSYKQKDIGESLIHTLESNGYTPYQYQLDAVKQALATIEKNNGVIVADVVGLGKTVIACCVAKELRKRGIIICPPGLTGDQSKTSGWSKYLEQFGLYDWEVWSGGKLEDVAKFVKKAKDIEVVVIDEVHRFRNQDTKDYEFLRNICRNRNVILLTATPFNNKPADILSLLKLFIAPKKSAITLENNLVDKFKHFKGVFDRMGYISKYWNSSDETKRKKSENYYQALFEEKTIDLKRVKQRSHYLAKQIRDVIEPVTIRRNRIDLKNNPFYKKEVKDLSVIQDPQEWYFELTPEQSAFYDTVIEEYFGEIEDGGRFRGAMYRPFEYETEKKKILEEKLSEKENFQYFQQKNLFDFMRRLIVKRFESSFGSFEQSIRNFKRITSVVLKFIEKTDKYILDRSLLEKIYLLDPIEIEEQLEKYSQEIQKGHYPKNHKIYEVSNFENKKDFINDIKSDLQLFDEILDDLSALDLVRSDPKVACLLDHVRKEFSKKPKTGEPRRKLIIFSEYMDTVLYLEPILKKAFGKRLLVAGRDLKQAKINEIDRNFDASYEVQKDDYDILLASDRISEGFNLNRAGMVINYDIPWNPVRVIQRLGRINRISKKVFDELFIVNFFPTEKGATIVKSREIASQKMFLIHHTLGEDSKIFDIDEEPTASGLFERLQQNPDKLESESFYTKVLKLFSEIQKKHPDVVEAVKCFPPRVKVAKSSKENELIVFMRKDRIYIRHLSYDDPQSIIEERTLEEMIENIKCEVDEHALPLSSGFWEAYEKVCNYKDRKAVPLSEQSLEQRSLNVLKTLLSNPWEDLVPHTDFVRQLREDIVDFGTLSDFTLRRIANMECSNDKQKKDTVKEIESLIEELGKDYLVAEKEKERDLAREIIIAIDNQAS